MVHLMEEVMIDDLGSMGIVREPCRGCGEDASNGFNGLCESCEENMKDTYGQGIDTTDYDWPA